MNSKLQNRLKLIDELERLCNSAEWSYPDGSNQDPLDFGIHSKEERIRAWHIPKTTGQFLFFLVGLLKPKNILELGTSIGYSTLWLGSAADQYGGHIDTIEYFDEKIKVANDYIGKAELKDTITAHKAKILDFLERASTKYDFIFMDADKGNYKRYFEIIKQKSSPNCLVVVDNAGNFKDRMRDFIDACTQDTSLNTAFLPFDNGLFLVQLGKEDSNLLKFHDLFQSYTAS